MVQDYRIECDETYTLSLTILDRVLQSQPIRPVHLQLLGAACLLIASKLKERNPLSTRSLSACSMGAFDEDRLKVDKCSGIDPVIRTIDGRVH